jgi:hypothetical protein
MDPEKSSSDDGKDKDIDLHYSYNDALSVAGIKVISIKCVNFNYIK